MSDSELDFYAYVQEKMREVFEESERSFAEYATKLGYVKPIKCRDCGAFVPWYYSDKEEVVQGECSYFHCVVPCAHYCSYAWIDED